MDIELPAEYKKRIRNGKEERAELVVEAESVEEPEVEKVGLLRRIVARCTGRSKWDRNRDNTSA